MSEQAPRNQSSKRVRAGERLAQLDEIEVEITQLVAGGDGLARFEGIPIFVPRSAPGDRARVRLTERKPDFGRAEIVDLIRPGPGRREPPCPHFGECGGCDLQHLEDSLQTDLKVEAVRETLRRMAGLDELPHLTVVAGAPWGYRCRTQLHTRPNQEGHAIGYLGRKSNKVVPINRCPVLVPELERLLPSLESSLPDPPPRRLDLLAGDPGQLSTTPVTPNLPHGPIEITVGEDRYSLDSRCFFQSHRQILPKLIEAAVGEWRGGLAIDLYAGIGFFSIPLARRYEKVVAVEGDRIAARYARQNAKHQRTRNLQVEARAVESWIPRLAEGADRVVVDPPRAGLTYRVRQGLAAKRPARLTYISCHPAALGRDLRVLLDDYDMEAVTVLDMFPQTGHVEVVVQLAASLS